MVTFGTSRRTYFFKFYSLSWNTGVDYVPFISVLHEKHTCCEYKKEIKMHFETIDHEESYQEINLLNGMNIIRKNKSYQ